MMASRSSLENARSGPGSSLAAAISCESCCLAVGAGDPGVHAVVGSAGDGVELGDADDAGDPVELGVVDGAGGEEEPRVLAAQLGDFDWLAGAEVHAVIADGAGAGVHAVVADGAGAGVELSVVDGRVVVVAIEDEALRGSFSKG